MKVVLKPGEMSREYPVNKPKKLVIKNWSGSSCKVSVTLYPETKEEDEINITGDEVFALNNEYTSVSFYWLECSDDELTFEFEAI
jgi:hypothetical protein